MTKWLVAGSALCILALILGGLFFIDGYHEWYWSSPSVFLLITLLGVLCSLAGGLLLGRALAAKREAAGGALQRFLFSAGAAVAIAGVFLGITALGTAISVSGTGYWGHPPYEYEGDYVIMRLQIDLFRFAVLPAMIGGVMFGAGLKMAKRE